jgi:hypothetical protein
MVPPARAGRPNKVGARPARTHANPPLCGSHSKQAASHTPVNPSARTPGEGRIYSDWDPKQAKRGRRSNFENQRKRSAGQSGSRLPVASRRRLPSCAGHDPGARARLDHLIKTEEAALFGRRAMSRTGAAVRPQARCGGDRHDHALSPLKSHTRAHARTLCGR